MSADQRPVAMVTGGGRGIGAAIAKELASNGYLTVLTGRDQKGLASTAAAITAAGGSAEARPLDVTDADAVEALARQLKAEGLLPEVLINNSGVGGQVGKLWDLDVDQWDDAFKVNVRGTFLCCKAFLPYMIDRGRGSVVSIGSACGKATLPERTPYAATKAALIGLTRTLAVDAGPYGVRVNLVSPANIEGDRLNWMLAKRAAADHVSEDAVREGMTRQSALKRFVAPNEVARVVAFLASDAASGITGEDINVSAGYVMY